LLSGNYFKPYTPTSLNLSFSRRNFYEPIRSIYVELKYRNLIKASFSLLKEASAELDSVKTEEVESFMELSKE
jgi:hypothetical protein|tara:strand:+ start:1460 stop:1678 length:219 start_codon:yes stop_codon:yes gene_type:complete